MWLHLQYVAFAYSAYYKINTTLYNDIHIHHSMGNK